MNQVLGSILQGRGRPLVISIGQGIGAVFTVTLLTTLIPPFGIRGAAVASTVACGVVVVVLLRGLRRARVSSSNSEKS